MPIPTDPVLLVLTALALWGFWAACVLRDKTAGGVGPQRDPMPSVAVGAAVRSLDALSASVPLATGPIPQQSARSGRVSLDRAGLEWPSSGRTVQFDIRDGGRTLLSRWDDSNVTEIHRIDQERVNSGSAS